MNSLLEEKKCIICNCNTYKILHKWPKGYYDEKEYETHSWDGMQPIPLQIVKCAKCNLIYTRPSFKEKYLDKIYPSSVIGKNLNIKDIFKPKDEKVDPILKICKRYLDNGSIIFDIGTRYGILPYIAEKKYGLNAYGIEFNAGAVKLGKKAFKNIYRGEAKDIKKITKKLNIKRINGIIMDDVLEHLVNPDRDIKMLSKLQKKDDYLFLRQMNYDSLGRILYGKRWYYFQPAAHMYYFNKNSIKKLLNKDGYKIVKIYEKSIFFNIIMTFIMELYKLMPKQIKAIAKYLLNKKNSQNSKNKPLYVIKRKKSYDDMFLVVARKC